jgi:uracil-DNA glycosylase family 4
MPKTHKPKLLLDICCAPDATQVIKLLEKDYEIAGYFYNPNIQPEAEYEKRLIEAERLFRLWNVTLYQDAPAVDEWLKAMKGLESAPEGGRRCEACFAFRLERAAQFAQENGFSIFTTTLTISPHKNAGFINQLGQHVARQQGIKFLSADFKKQDGFKKSIELAKELALYRQDYCGCSFSKREREFFKLSKTIRNCRKCTLPKTSYPIFSGTPTNRLMLVGQAPGKKELAVGKPFSGPAGKRLFRWLGLAGIDETSFRSAVHMTAVMKCFPGPASHGDRKPSPEELNNCAPFLDREIEFVRPEIIIPVGQMAIERFLGKRRLDQGRLDKRRLDEIIGKKFKKIVAGQECTLIPLPHPSGASPWSYQKHNTALLKKAIRLVKKYLTKE